MCIKMCFVIHSTVRVKLTARKAVIFSRNAGKFSHVIICNVLKAREMVSPLKHYRFSLTCSSLEKIRTAVVVMAKLIMCIPHWTLSSNPAS